MNGRLDEIGVCMWVLAYACMFAFAFSFAFARMHVCVFAF
jgi:hypothetical protein